MYKKDLAHYSSPTTLFDFYMEGRNYIVSKVSSRLWAKIIFQGLSERNLKEATILTEAHG